MLLKHISALADSQPGFAVPHRPALPNDKRSEDPSSSPLLYSLLAVVVISSAHLNVRCFRPKGSGKVIRFPNSRAELMETRHNSARRSKSGRPAKLSWAVAGCRRKAKVSRFVSIPKRSLWNAPRRTDVELPWSVRGHGCPKRSTGRYPMPWKATGPCFLFSPSIEPSSAIHIQVGHTRPSSIPQSVDEMLVISGNRARDRCLLCCVVERFAP